MAQYSQIIFIVAIIAVFYFLIIRPQKKRQSDQAELMSNLKPGAEILTIGGLYGTIDSIDDDRVRLVVADGSELVFAKSAIARIVAPTVDDADEDADEDADDAIDVDIDAGAIGEADDVTSDVVDAKDDSASDVAEPDSKSTEDASADV
ncbi:MAG: preprotein translocase subunit YajC [Coriobacteriia bacterium]